MAMRHWVLFTPYGPTNYTVYEDHQERKAVADFEERRLRGQEVSFVTTTGGLADVRKTLKRLRSERTTLEEKKVSH